MDPGNTTSASPPLHASPEAAQTRKKRVRNWTPKDRAQHRIFEKQRREAFNASLMRLARSLPSLDDTKDNQLSKHVIVDESIRALAEHKAELASLKISFENLEAERTKLINEVNSFRGLVGMEPYADGQADEVATRQNAMIEGGAVRSASLTGVSALPENYAPIAAQADEYQQSSNPLIPPYQATNQDMGQLVPAVGQSMPVNPADFGMPQGSDFAHDPNLYAWPGHPPAAIQSVAGAAPPLPYQTQGYSVWEVSIQ